MPIIFDNNFEEYENPELYDVENHTTHEVDLLEEWANGQGAIIDLACGTGRITISLAEKGYKIIGVDLHEGMLQRAKEKSTDLSIKWYKQDISQLSLEIKSDLIYLV